jgi:hypothetical protein
MNGNVFECHEEQTDRRQYAKTLEALQGYVKKNLKFADDIAPLFAATMVRPNRGETNKLKGSQVIQPIHDLQRRN